METKPNPANATAKPVAAFKRIPMSVPVRKLEVPEIPGYHLHWFKSDEQRLQQALQGGYEFVDRKEVRLNSVSLGGTGAVDASTDMGSRVSIISGGDGAGGPERLILMKIKQEWYEEDQKLLENRNDQIAGALAGGTVGAAGAADSRETNLRYVGKTTTIPDLFKKGAMAKKNRPPPT